MGSTKLLPMRSVDDAHTSFAYSPKATHAVYSTNIAACKPSTVKF